MRFTFVFDGLGYGGIERVGVDYCNALFDRGHDVCVINLVPRLNAFASKLNSGIVYKEKDFSKTRAPERYCTLVKRVSWGRFVYPIIFTATSLALGLSRPALRSGVDGADVAIAFSGHYNDLTFVGCNCTECSIKIAWLHGTINDYAMVSDGYLNLYKKFDGLACLSKEGFERFVDSNKYLKFSIKRIYNPIPTNCAHDDKNVANRLKEEFGDFILSVGRFEKPKDFASLVKAVSILKNERGITNKCVLLGDGPDLDSTKRLVSEYALDNQIIFKGYCENPSPYYNACKMFVLSSKNEGLPTVVLEAMAHGKPVLSTDTPGAREILGADEFGLLCPVGDYCSMADKMEKLLVDEMACDHYSMMGMRRIGDFSVSKAIDSLLNYVDELCSEDIPNA